jgi:hypothetical protein
MLLKKDGYGNAVQGIGELGTTRSVAISTVSTVSTTAFGSDTIRLCATQDCFFTIGDAPITAVAGNHYLPVGAIEYVNTGGGTNKKIATIGSATGTLYISEVK